MAKRLILLLALLFIFPLIYADHDYTSVTVNTSSIWETDTDSLNIKVDNHNVGNDEIIEVSATLPYFSQLLAYYPETQNISGNNIIWNNLSIEYNEITYLCFSGEAIEVTDNETSEVAIITKDDKGVLRSHYHNITIMNDIYKPSAILISPINGTFVKNEPITIEISASDLGVGVANATMYWDADSSPIPVVDEKGKVFLELKDGNYVDDFKIDDEQDINKNSPYLNYFFLVSDKLKNEEVTKDYTIYVDTEEPTLTLDHPEDDLMLDANPYGFNFTLLDNSFDTLSEGFFPGVTCELYIYKTSSYIFEDSIIAENNGDYNITADLSTLDDGTYDWFIECEDNATWTVKKDRTFMMDNYGPKLDLVSPEDDAWTTGNQTFKWTTNDIINDSVLCDFYLDNITNNTQDIESDRNIETNYIVEGLSEGNHTWYVSCWDDSNHINTSETRQFTTDLTDPIITIDSPDNNTIVTDENMFFNVTVSDNLDDIMECEFYLDDTLIEIKDADDNVMITFEYNKNSSGEYLDWYFICNDSSNSKKSDVRTLYLDNQLETPVFSSIPSTLSTANSNLFVTFRAIFNEEVTIDSAKLDGTDINVTTADNKTFDYSNTLNSNAHYNFSVSATDLYVNTAGGEHDFHIEYTGGSNQNQNSGGGGGSGGGTPQQSSCNYDWRCTEWSECTPEGKQTRVCTNYGDCVGVESRPADEISCVYEEEEIVVAEEETPLGTSQLGIGASIMGQLKDNWWVIVLAAIIIGVLAFIGFGGPKKLHFRKYKPTKFEPIQKNNNAELEKNIQSNIQEHRQKVGNQEFKEDWDKDTWY